MIGHIVNKSWNFSVLNGTLSMPKLELMYYNDVSKDDVLVDSSHDIAIYHIKDNEVDFSEDDFVYFSNKDVSLINITFIGLSDLVVDEVKATISDENDHELCSNDSSKVQNNNVLLNVSEIGCNIGSTEGETKKYNLNLKVRHKDTEEYFNYFIEAVVDKKKPSVNNFNTTKAVNYNNPFIDIDFDLDEDSGYRSSAEFNLSNITSLIRPDPINVLLTYPSNDPDVNIVDYMVLMNGYNTIDELPIKDNLEDGFYNLTMTTYDQAGNYIRNWSKIKIDTHPAKFNLSYRSSVNKVVVYNETKVYTNGTTIIINFTLDSSVYEEIQNGETVLVCYENNLDSEGNCENRDNWEELKKDTIEVPSIDYLVYLTDQYNAETTNNIKFITEDGAGNLFEKTTKVVVDKKAPEILSIEGNMSWDNPLTVTFDEDSEILTARLYNEGSSFALNSYTDNGNSFRLFPAEKIDNGTYVVDLVVSDVFGNFRYYNTDYHIDYVEYPLDLDIFVPGFGWSSTEKTYFKVIANKPVVECRYDNQPLKFKALANTMEMDDGSGIVYSSTVEENITEFGSFIRFGCKTEFGENVTKDFELHVDPSPA